MTSSNAKPIIALDGDGVLLDYDTAYARVWHKAFGETPTLKEPNAYWPKDRWGLPQLEGEELQHFKSHFDEDYWSTIPAMPSALEACRLLVDNGYTLVCVTAIKSWFKDARTRNLMDLGLPIASVVATGNDASVRSPKAAALTEMRPVAFVDDYAPYLVDVDAGIHRALIARDSVGSPNVGDVLREAHSQHANVLEFAQWWIQR